MARFVAGRPLVYQPVLLIATASALRQQHMCAMHRQWIAFVVSAMPYLGRALAHFVCATAAQICHNLELLAPLYELGHCYRKYVVPHVLIKLELFSLVGRTQWWMMNGWVRRARSVGLWIFFFDQWHFEVMWQSSERCSNIVRKETEVEAVCASYDALYWRWNNNNTQQQQPFYGPLSGTTRVSWYQKKHSPTILIIIQSLSVSSIYYDP